MAKFCSGSLSCRRHGDAFAATAWFSRTSLSRAAAGIASATGGEVPEAKKGRPTDRGGQHHRRGARKAHAGGSAKRGFCSARFLFFCSGFFQKPALMPIVK